MHPLIAKIVGRPAIANWRAHQKSAAAAGAKFNQFTAQASAHEASIVAAADKFRDSPTPANFDDWVMKESRRAVLASISMDLRQLATNAAAQALHDGGADKLLAAVEEAEGVLNDREAKTREEDARRSAELGVPVSSPAVFAEIERMRGSLAAARSWAESDLSQAVGALQTVIGSD